MPRGIYKRTPEYLEKLRKNPPSNKGGKFSDASKLKCSLAQMRNKKALGVKRSEKFKENIKDKLKGRPSVLRGTKKSIETRFNMQKAQQKRIDDGTHNFWKGGINKINLKIRGSLEYKLWRESVFERDKWTCVWCGEKGGKIHADHIKPFALYPELRFALDNGRTLCVPCHRTTDTWGRGTYKQLK
jgi:hypothetical protein